MTRRIPIDLSGPQDMVDDLAARRTRGGTIEGATISIQPTTVTRRTHDHRIAVERCLRRAAAPSWRELAPFADLFLISFLILFFELACIRWFGSTVIFLTFFTNIVLMACFLGMSVGCLAASRRRDLHRRGRSR